MDTNIVKREKRDRLLAEHIAQWRSDYQRLLRKFRAGLIDEGELSRGFAQLGFRSDAHNVEMIEARKLRLKAMGPS